MNLQQHQQVINYTFEMEQNWTSCLHGLSHVSSTAFSVSPGGVHLQRLTRVMCHRSRPPSPWTTQTDLIGQRLSDLNGSEPSRSLLPRL